MATKAKTTTPSKTAAPKPAAPASSEVAVKPTASGALARFAKEIKTRVTGFEEATSAAYAIPFLRLLQDLSPQVKTLKAGYIPGAKVGQVFNTASKGLYDRVRVVPCYYQQSMIEWKPRATGAEGGAGFVAVHPANTPLIEKVHRDEKSGKNLLPNGNELADTRSHYVILLHEDGSTEGCLIAMSSTSLKVSRNWMTMMKVACGPSAEFPQGLPMFAFSYELWSEDVSNSKGQWKNWVIGNKKPVESVKVIEEAEAFAAAIAAGNKVKVDYTQMREEAADTREQESGAPADLDNEIDA